MDRSLDWDDLRVVLAIFREGTPSGAARRLGVPHSTAFRRLGGIEDKMGLGCLNASATAMRRRRLARQRRSR
jgi:DNA-binding transcriptional LysR family regulator